jgi:hypothetical protein
MALTISAALAIPGAARAAPTSYTSAVAFFTSLPGPATTAGFDGLSSGETISSDESVDGITFSHDLDGVDLIVTDGTAAGGGGPFETVSAPNFLGTSDLDVLIDGDDLALGFNTANAVGLFVITAETPGHSLFDGDIRLAAAGAAAALDVDDVQATLADGSRVYFLGVIDPDSTFNSASIGTFGAGGEFAFNGDDMVTALPEPRGAWALASGLLALAAGRRRRPSV